MTARVVAAGDPAYDDLFNAIERSWFRLETLQQYSSGDADLVRMVASGHRLPRQNGPWYDMLRAHAAAGRSLHRVHIIEEPHSPYITYELAAYRDTAAAGEDVRIVPTPAGDWPAGLPRQDFWLLDKDQVWTLRYDDNGALEVAEQVIDPDEIEMHQHWAGVAWRAAVPWAEYLARAGLGQVI